MPQRRTLVLLACTHGSCGFCPAHWLLLEALIQVRRHLGLGFTRVVLTLILVSWMAPTRFVHTRFRRRGDEEWLKREMRLCPRLEEGRKGSSISAARPGVPPRNFQQQSPLKASPAALSSPEATPK